jgi:serine-type D-Ala-D-Ala carboxypeptidase/endopeptidase (penicillin-binding protein 4)
MAYQDRLHTKISLIIPFLGLTLWGCGTTRTLRVPQDPLIQLHQKINAVLSDSLFVPARASIKVVSIADGKTLYERDSKALMNPASNMKILTSAAALSILDTNFLFRTSVFVDAIPTDGAVESCLYLKGYGDPDLSSADLDSLAISIRRSGITSIAGDIVVDDSYFDDNYWGAGWTWDDESDPDAPYINALSVNKNCISITLLTDSSAVYPYVDPATSFVTVVNRSKLTADSIRTPLKIRRVGLANPNTIVSEGEISHFSQFTQKFSLRRPEYYTGTIFKEALNHAGISVAGDIVNGVTPAGVREIARHEQPIEKVITTMNKESDNLSAENILKIIGAVKNGKPGSAKNGIYAEKCFLVSLGIDTVHIFIADGSGVSRYNLLTADQIVRILIAIYKEPRIFPFFYNSLPIAGVDGTLSRRMMTYPAACNLRAKTGTLNGVSCLSGYVQTSDGEMLAFSIMMQNFITSVTDYREVQDRIGALLAGFSRRNLIRKVQ